MLQSLHEFRHGMKLLKSDGNVAYPGFGLCDSGRQGVSPIPILRENLPPTILGSRDWNKGSRPLSPSRNVPSSLAEKSHSITLSFLAKQSATGGTPMARMGGIQDFSRVTLNSLLCQFPSRFRNRSSIPGSSRSIGSNMSASS